MRIDGAGCLFACAQVWEDQAIWNVDFCTLFPQMRVSELYVPQKMHARIHAHRYPMTANHARPFSLIACICSNDLERMYLTAMQFQVNVKASL